MAKRRAVRATSADEQVREIVNRIMRARSLVAQMEPAAGYRTLASMGLEGALRLILITELEATFSIDLPSDLVAAIETVDDLVYYVTIHYTRENPRSA
jgi:hypothetical protein